MGNLHLASKGAPAAAPSSGAPPPLYNPEEIAGIVPADARQTYDVRDVIARVVDGSEFDEFKKVYGPVSLRQFAAKLILHVATNLTSGRHFPPKTFCASSVGTLAAPSECTVSKAARVCSTKGTAEI